MGIFSINFSRFKWLDQMKCQVIAFIQSILFCRIRTIGQLAESDEKLLESHFGKIGNVLWAFANGWDSICRSCVRWYSRAVEFIWKSGEKGKVREEFHWHDEYATLNFFRFICKNIGNLGNGEIEKMVARLKSIDQKAVENHVNGAVWAFDYDKIFCVLMENEICRKVREKNKYNSWMKLIGQYCISMA